jgi:hypothetical protein
MALSDMDRKEIKGNGDESLNGRTISKVRV